MLENKFDRGDEMDADKVSVMLTEKAGYAPGTLAAFLGRLDDRNRDQPEQNGLFASHPDTKPRIDAIKKIAGAKGRGVQEGDRLIGRRKTVAVCAAFFRQVFACSRSRRRTPVCVY